MAHQMCCPLVHATVMVAKQGVEMPVLFVMEVEVQRPPKRRKKAKKKAKSDFSVKAFWAEKILEKSPVSKLPR